MARLLEDDALGLLREAGIDVPPYETVSTPEATADAVMRLGGHAVLKALIPVGGRGKAGAVQLVEGKEEALATSRALLGKTILHYPITELLVSALVDIERELFVSFAFDSETKRPQLLFSAEGGVDIETILKENPASLIRHPISLLHGLTDLDAQRVTERGGLNGDAATNVATSLCTLWRVFSDCEAAVLEINPLVLTPDNNVVAPTGVVGLDDDALPRHLKLAEAADRIRTNGWRPLSALELEMRRIDATDDSSGIRFNEFPEGDIALMVSGGGTGMSALDALYRAGGRAACTMDITPGRIEEKTYLATKAILSSPNVKGLLAGSPFINFIPVDVKVRGTMRALEEMGVDPQHFPIVFRFDGPNIENAKELAAALPGIVFFDAATPMEVAAQEIVRLTYDKGAELG
jgi:succinyl-CoA synthetase beta subunit